ncbi:outer membrane transport energization protein ExbD [Nitrosospira sp. Nsp5]|jgi:biopolymer transport protein ExbD|uniref:Biopolymer transport protein ExbD n=1 Tax=Nitrosospira multiformis TaxID=1231 RepID=A0ABY0T963_9PROT|nr:MULTISPECIES: biopolymer transporter ExbD [Nitrosospira]PTR08031.1 outer membrane transport energization protein ExbD [Nitrosospira sp. Nsp5]SCY19363.1 biopolymer transport protein ExbD [Nitrosospira sp. Nsp13]SDQ47198.1 biopolymer transport protein ExbD [Nitrosospira multiformis]
MSGDVKEDNQPYDEINITPMLDLAYVLLVIFIIMTTASVQGVKVELPHTRNTASLAQPQTRAITVTLDGAVYLDAYPVDMVMLEQRLSEFKGNNPSLPVVLKADAAAHYDKVSEVLEICKKLGITEIGLVTKKSSE